MTRSHLEITGEIMAAEIWAFNEMYGIQVEILEYILAEILVEII